MSILAKIGVIVLGCALFIVGLVLMGMHLPQVATVPFLLAGVCMAAIVSPIIGDFFVGFINPSNIPDAPDEYTAVRAMIARHEFDEAVAELRQVIADDPTEVNAKILLITVLYDRLKRLDEALEVAMLELRTATTWTDTHERVVSMATDIALELGRRDLAIDALERGLALCRRVGPAAEGFASRLAGLRG